MDPQVRHTDVVIAFSWAELALVVALAVLGLRLLRRRRRRGG